MSTTEHTDVRSDSTLVADFVAGDDSAFTALVHRHQNRVYSICLRYFQDETDANDAAQDTFLVLYRRAETFQGTAAFTTWLYRLTINVCNDIVRRRKRRPQRTGTEITEIPLVDPSDPSHTAALRADLAAALAQLSTEQRNMVIARSVLGTPYEQIAEAHHLPVGTIKSRIHRAHAKLQQILDDSSEQMERNR